MDNFNSCEELDQAIYEQVTDLSECGNLLMEQGCYEEALLKFEFALSLLPSPQEKWDAFTWLKAATSDAYFFMKNFKKCKDEAFDGMKGPGGVDNEFLLMRIDECFYEESGFFSERAADFLARAYMLGGDDIFLEEDPKYLKFIKDILD